MSKDMYAECLDCGEELLVLFGDDDKLLVTPCERCMCDSFNQGFSDGIVNANSKKTVENRIGNVSDDTHISDNE